MNGKMSITTKRLRKLIDNTGMTRQAIAEEMGCDVSTVIKHYNGDRSVNSEFIVRYAEYFRVSTDYLLGCENNPTENEIINLICDYTGLSEEAVKKLHKADYLSAFDTFDDLTIEEYDEESQNYRNDRIDILNKFIELNYLTKLIEIIGTYRDEIYSINMKQINSIRTMEKNYQEFLKGNCDIEKLGYDYYFDHGQEKLYLFDMQELPKEFVRHAYAELLCTLEQTSKKRIEIRERNIKCQKDALALAFSEIQKISESHPEWRTMKASEAFNLWKSEKEGEPNGDDQTEE